MDIPAFSLRNLLSLISLILLLLFGSVLHAEARPDLAGSIGVDRFQVRAGETLGITLHYVNYGKTGVVGWNLREGMSEGSGMTVVLSRDRRVRVPMVIEVPPRFVEDRTLPGGLIQVTPNLGPGRSWRFRGVVRIPEDVPPGGWWLCVVSDPLNRIPESNERNNVTCKDIFVHPAEGSETGRSESPGRTGDSGRRKEKESPGREIARGILEEILWGQREDRDKGKSPPARSMKGKGEHKEKSSRRRSFCDDGTRPDLEAYTMKIWSRSLRRGEKNRMLVTVGNMGSDTARGFDGDCGYKLQVVVTRRAGVPAPAKMVLAGDRFQERFWRDTWVIFEDDAPPDIEPGKYYSPSGKFVVPAEVPPGTYTVCLVVDPENTLHERKEGNNVKCIKRIQVR